MALQIFAHSALSLFRNFPQALKASIAPTIVGVFIGYIFFYFYAVGASELSFGSPVYAATSMLPFVLMILVCYLIILSWVAVTWHRFVLMDEEPNFIPTFSGKPVWPYLRRLLMIILQVILAMLPLLMILLLGGQALGRFIMGNPIIMMLINFGLSIVFSFFWIRISLSLPATAVGEKMGSFDALNESKKASSTIWIFALLLTVFNTAIGIGFPFLLYYLPDFLVFFLTIVYQWFVVMFGISILTTLFGHLIEGRPLSDL